MNVLPKWLKSIFIVVAVAVGLIAAIVPWVGMIPDPQLPRIFFSIEAILATILALLVILRPFGAADVKEQSEAGSRSSPAIGPDSELKSESDEAPNKAPNRLKPQAIQGIDSEKIEEFRRRQNDLKNLLADAARTKNEAEQGLEKTRQQLADAVQKTKEASQLKQKAELDRSAAAKELDAAKRERVEAERSKEEQLKLHAHAASREAENIRREGELVAEEEKLTRRERAAEKRNQEADEKLAAAENDLKVAEAKRADAVTERCAAETARNEMLAAKSILERLRRDLWPAWVGEDSLEPPISEIERLAGEGDPNASVLLAYLHVLQAIEKHASTNREFNYLWATVREIGRFLASLLTEQGVSAQETAERMTHWARVVNQAGRGRFTVGIPAVGEPFNSAQMQSSTPGIQTVSRVSNWWVSNSKAITASKAEVS